MFILFIVLISHETQCLDMKKFVEKKKEDVETAGKNWLCQTAKPMLNRDPNLAEWVKICKEQSLEEIKKYIETHTTECPVKVYFEKVYITTTEEIVTYVNGKQHSVEWN